MTSDFHSLFIREPIFLKDYRPSVYLIERVDLIFDLFEDKTQILCETQKTRPDLLEWAQDWFKKTGMNLREMDPVEHDQHITYVSHLSHISSYMLGKTVMEKEKDQSAIFDMAGSGFSSTVRLAKSSPHMWVPIFKQNKDNITETLTQYINNLNQFKQLLDANQFDKFQLTYRQNPKYDQSRVLLILNHALQRYSDPSNIWNSGS